MVPRIVCAVHSIFSNDFIVATLSCSEWKYQGLDPTSFFSVGEKGKKRFPLATEKTVFEIVVPASTGSMWNVFCNKGGIDQDRVIRLARFNHKFIYHFKSECFAE